MNELDNMPRRFVDKPSLPQQMVYTKAGKFSNLSFWNTISGKMVGNKARFTPLTVYTGNTTCYRNVTYTNSLVITYNVSGNWYKNVPSSGTGPTVRWWTSAGSAGESVSNSSATTYVWVITDVYYNTNTCVNANTTSSYLKHNYNYDVTAYLSVAGQGLIPYNNFNITGYQTYGTSYIP